ncbi:MAG: helicase [Opitutaceae bacterium]|nr:helicase [Opitutaceae bacterium]
MQFSLEQRSARLSVGDFAAFTLGPHGSGAGLPGRWRAQLGTHWHQQLRAQAVSEQAGAEFEVPIEGRISHRGWTLTLTGRMDQLLPIKSSPREGGAADRSAAALAEVDGREMLLREIKTVTRPLPTDERELRADYPEYFVQLATYVALLRLAPNSKVPAPRIPAPRAELVFVETGSGLAQTVALTLADDALFRAQLERVAEFLDLRWRARERLRLLRFRPAFAELRPGQETTAADLKSAIEQRQSAILFEAPTGFGKTGVLLECALGQLRAGHFERVLYLTSKSTGQLQVVRTLTEMTRPMAEGGRLEAGGRRPDSKPHASGLQPPVSAATSVAAWHVRNKSEHCINHIFHCVRDQCAFLAGAEARWPQSGLARFYLFENEPRDLPALRAAGRAATLCPYEITRAALAFNDVWIGDYNYVFAPRNRGLFYEQPGFDPARTLLLLDEAHNLPSRVADAYSYVARADDARALLTELDHLPAPAPLLRAWESWTRLLAALQPVEALDAALEADAADTLGLVARELEALPLDYAALGPHCSEVLWQAPQIAEWLANPQLKRHLWSPRASELHFTCIDAAAAIGETLRAYGGVVFASATLSPSDAFAESCGLDAPRPVGTPHYGRESANVPSGSPLARGMEQPAGVSQINAHTPWRAGAYDVAVDARVDTTFHQRVKYHAMTAATVEALHAAAQNPFFVSSHVSPAGARSIAVFFPSYAYAETIRSALEQAGSALRVALQPRLPDLAAQVSWVEESLAFTDVLFLVLGSSFAESIDLLGGRVTSAMVVGPALPEVNAVQRARLAEFSARGRAAAFRRVYQIPGMTKVNQALGRLVRAPGQRARVLLHCRRFLEPSYASLLATDYQFGTNLLDDADFTAWLARACPPLPS